MTFSTIAMLRNGFSSGSVIRVNSCQRVAPSTIAAS